MVFFITALFACLGGLQAYLLIEYLIPQKQPNPDYIEVLFGLALGFPIMELIFYSCAVACCYFIFLFSIKFSLKISCLEFYLQVTVIPPFVSLSHHILGIKVNETPSDLSTITFAQRFSATILFVHSQL